MTEPDEIRSALITQLHSPVRWTESVRKITGSGIMKLAECGPGRVLSGLGRRIERGAQWAALEQPGAIEANHQRLEGKQFMTPEAMSRIDGRVALVTGASRGIGQATAAWLKAMGADVFGTATSEAGAEAISQRLGDGRGLVLNVTDGDAITEVVGQIAKVSPVR
jgi:hypothetical protein